MLGSTLCRALVATLWVGLFMLVSGAAAAVEPGGVGAEGAGSRTRSGAGAAPQSQEGGDQQEQEEEQEQEEVRFEEIIVVTASRMEQLLLEAPSAMSVLDSSDIALSPATNYADLLRSVPGLNVTQTSARDVNMASRSATGTLEASQLVLVDGRTVYQDFFGFVAWDLLPLDFSEIEQIEVIRGPGSAVWGANALNGVVNVITKTPRQLGDMFRIRLGGGERGTGFASATYSAIRDDLSYRTTAGYFTQEAWDRPPPLPNGMARDSFPNAGTKQPKFDARIDYEVNARSSLSLSGGYAGSGGVIHTGIGPFTMEDGTRFWYLRGDYDRGALNARGYVNVLDGEGTNLLNGLLFTFDSSTFDFSLSNTSVIADTHTITYGGNLRTIQFDLSIAPDEDSRSEGGVFAAADFQLGEYVTLHAGGRADWFSVLDSAVASPRFALLVSPSSNHVFRVSYGRAYRVPSLINNFLDVTIFNVAPLPTGPFFFPSRVFGNAELVEQSQDQVEVGYRGVLLDGDLSVDLAWYRADSQDTLDFFTKSNYSFFSPPPGFPAALRCILPGSPDPSAVTPPPSPPCPPPGFLPVVALPAEFSYRNIGTFIDEGIEIGLRYHPIPRNTLSVNYSWQDTPEVEGVPLAEVNVAPEHRFSAGWGGWVDALYYSASVNHVDEARWTDVLDSRFWGTTESFTTLDASVGYLFLDGTAELSLRGTNLTDEPFLQHIFGDIIGRRVIAELALFVR